MDNWLTVFEHLSSPGPRLPWVQTWLLEVWNAERYGCETAVHFLRNGEKQVNELETVIAVAAPGLYDEMLYLPPDRNLLTFLRDQQPCAAVVFDGMSVRELPLVVRLAEQSGLNVREVGMSYAALPSETNDFIEQRLETGARISPAQLPGRRELRALGITSYYYGHVNDRQVLASGEPALLIWSRFPDALYQDSGARFAQHFDQIHTQFAAAWMNTVQQIPRGRPIVVTSDHGYIFLEHTAGRQRSEMQAVSQRFGNERFYRLNEGQDPLGHPDVPYFPSRRLECLRGRVTTFGQGEPANRLYRHGGLSLMEMLTPWLVLDS